MDRRAALRRPTFNNRLGQFFDKERHAIRALQDLVLYRGGEFRSAGNLFDHFRRWLRAKSGECQGGDMGQIEPCSGELWSRRNQHKDFEM